jgi:type VI secretion system secreted protein VgrG
LYQYEIEIKSPLSAEIDLDDVLDNPARFVTRLDGKEYPVYGVLSSFDELQTVQGYVYYRAVLVPKLWWLSIYKTNEIYTEEKTVDKIIQTTLENAGFTSGTDFDLGGLDTSKFLVRDYVCQFGESDLDFISRMMENEGIFYYFEHDSGSAEKIIFINDMNYLKIPQPELIFDVKAQASRQHDCINAWSCRKQRLPESVSVRDFNPEQPSLDISDTMPIDNMGQGTEYLYGVNVRDGEEATYLSQIRAEERLCSKTRYYGESSVTRLQAGYLFSMDGHPNSTYNGAEYLAIEVSHEGRHLDMEMSAPSSRTTQPTPQYRNSFVAMDATVQYRPPQKTPKPRFFGTMTAFVYAETGKKNAEVDEEGRYRVHLPFDRADGTKDSTDPNRKASTWIRMAQPYVGQEQGMYFPLADGTEVLLTFINGDPDQPIISGALPNASQPSLLNSEMNLQRTKTRRAWHYSKTRQRRAFLQFWDQPISMTTITQQICQTRHKMKHRR